MCLELNESAAESSGKAILKEPPQGETDLETGRLSPDLPAEPWARSSPGTGRSAQPFLSK